MNLQFSCKNDSPLVSVSKVSIHIKLNCFVLFGWCTVLCILSCWTVYIRLRGVYLCLRLTSDHQSVWDSRLVEHSLDVVVVESERLSFPALWVHQQHHPARTRQLARQQPYRGEKRKMMTECNKKRKDKWPIN